MQAGYIFKNGRYWTLRYYEMELENGQPIRKQKHHKLALIGEQCPTKSSVRALADTFLAPINRVRSYHCGNPHGYWRFLLQVGFWQAIS